MKRGERQTSNAQRSTSKEEGADRGAYDLEERLLEFAARIIRLVDAIYATRAGNHVAGQLLRSGTSPLPNHGEAQAAESRADFIHKLKICLKELIESRRWLKLIWRVPLVGKPEKIELLIQETEELIRIFARSLQTAKANQTLSARVQELPELADQLPLSQSLLELGVERWMLDVKPLAGPASPEDAP